MAESHARYVSRLVPRNTKVFTAVVIAVAVVNSATLGYDSSLMNGLQILPSYTDYFHLNTATNGLNNAASWMGAILATPLLQFVPDNFGRKKAILLSAIVCFIGIILQSASQNIGMFIVARMIVGLGSQLSSAASPALLGELLPAVTRGRILGFFFSCFYVGSLASAIINYGSQNIQSTWSWRLPSLLQIIPSLLALCLLPFVPESPRWLISQGRHDQPLWQLCHFALSVPQLTRNNSFYLDKILTQAGITDTTTKTQINVILSCFSFVVACFGSYMLDIIGRRKQALGSVASMIVCLYIVGGMIKKFGESSNKSGIYGTIAFIFLFQGFYAFSITPLTSLYPTEISQYKLRTTGIAIFRL
ncbi:hypothetical protein LTR10_014620 [Elasticomyces elasticus]|uniref:Major facilitator superfamily (MFS) profile domain-containing protein n=1 Tax=Exophiala sideris TaxID=1016849 RepID=A0ABR0JSM9_9EURO|nr:hypothetical protein LTR10_014620 [Elasticomyces elasticus]KAK5040597.1 hypothetical protein LTS07_001097 [Exophiala sideris]KAK5068975.1 hypothetical protein LTR69_001098 [Exophiala sideris]KAK5186572.1 hypothetical protein LTR44_001629 [Eurotiomycetes sp. CCFEE 6388]